MFSVFVFSVFVFAIFVFAIFVFSVFVFAVFVFAVFVFSVFVFAVFVFSVFVFSVFVFAICLLYTLADLFGDETVVGVNAQTGGNFHGFFGDFLGVHLGFAQQSAGRRRGEAAAGADGNHIILWLDNIAEAGDNQRIFGISHHQQCFQAAQVSVGAPILGKFHRSALQHTFKLFQLLLKALKQREGIGSGAGETREDLVIVNFSDLAGIGFHHHIAHGHLAVAHHRHLVLAPYGQDSGPME